MSGCSHAIILLIIWDSGKTYGEPTWDSGSQDGIRVTHRDSQYVIRGANMGFRETQDYDFQ